MMKIFYMNQGGGGHWGAVRYTNYDLLLLAESSIIKSEFESVWESTNNPIMNIQKQIGTGRLITGVRDLDVTAQCARPQATFQIVDTNIRVVFVHLKSASEQLAASELETAIQSVSNIGKGLVDPILWIGDFNRAPEYVMGELGADRVFYGGGQAKWKLDRAYTTGDWSNYSYSASSPTNAGADHGHIAIEFIINKK